MDDPVPVNADADAARNPASTTTGFMANRTAKEEMRSKNDYTNMEMDDGEEIIKARRSAQVR